MAAQPTDPSQIICIEQTHESAWLSLDELHLNLRIYGRIHTTSATARMARTHPQLSSFSCSEKRQKQQGWGKKHITRNKEINYQIVGGRKEYKPKENEDLAITDVMQEAAEKKHLPLAWKKSAQKRAAWEMSTLTACSPPWGVLFGFSSKQKVQVQTLLPKFLSEMVPSQAGDPKSLSEQLEQSFASGAMHDRKAQICLL